VVAVGQAANSRQADKAGTTTVFDIRKLLQPALQLYENIRLGEALMKLDLRQDFDEIYAHVVHRVQTFDSSSNKGPGDGNSPGNSHRQTRTRQVDPSGSDRQVAEGVCQ
jgi:hypothetical protein